MAERHVRIDFSGICSFVADNWASGAADTTAVGKVDVLLVHARASSLADSLCDHFPVFIFPINESGVTHFLGMSAPAKSGSPYLTVPRLDKPLALVGILPLHGKRISFAITTDTNATPQALDGGVLKQPSFDRALDLDLLMSEAGAPTVGVNPDWREPTRVEGLVGARIRLEGGTLGIDTTLVERKFRRIAGEGGSSGGKEFAQSVYWTFPVTGPVKNLVVKVWRGTSLECELYFATGSTNVPAPRFGVSNLCGERVLGVGPPELSRDIAVFYDLATEAVPAGQRLVAEEPDPEEGVEAGTDSCPPVRQTWT